MRGGTAIGRRTQPQKKRASSLREQLSAAVRKCCASVMQLSHRTPFFSCPRRAFEDKLPELANNWPHAWNLVELGGVYRIRRVERHLAIFVGSRGFSMTGILACPWWAFIPDGSIIEAIFSNQKKCKSDRNVIGRSCPHSRENL